MRTGAKVFLGCLAAPFVLVLLLGILALVYRSLPMPPEERGSVDLEQPLDVPAVTEAQLSAEGLAAGSGVPAGQPLSVTLRMEEGDFTIKPAPPGTGIRVEGDYDKGTYELHQELVHDSSGAPVYTLSFKPRYSMMRRLLSHGFVEIDESQNRLTVHLPQGLPMDLRASLRKGASRMELGGLALTSAVIDLEMGEHEVSVAEPNPLEMSSLELNVGMGETHLRDLGNLRASNLTVWGKMGQVDVDLGSRIARDTKLVTRMRMGEMTLGLPTQARVTTRTNVFMGAASGARQDKDDEQGAAESGFALQVQAGITMGELRIHRH